MLQVEFLKSRNNKFTELIKGIDTSTISFQIRADKKKLIDIDGMFKINDFTFQKRLGLSL